MAEGRCPLVLTERIQHLTLLGEAVPAEKPRVILATGRYIGEGFDDARLDTLFLAMPISWRGTLQQYVGRLHRLHHNKQEVRVYDYADQKVPVLKRMLAKRIRGYRALGYSIGDQMTLPDAPQ